MAQRLYRWGSASLQFGVAQVLVDGLPADPVVTGKEGFRDTVAGALDQVGSPFRREGLLPPFVRAALLGQGDALPLAFPDEGAFEFGEGTHDGQHEVGHGGVLAGEDQALLDELHPHAFAGQDLDKGTQVIEVPGEPVHAVDHNSVAIPGEPQQLRKLRSGSVPAGGLVREDPVQNYSFELAFLILVKSAYSDLPDPLSCHRRLQPSSCQVES
jgi:hypothetical protein